MPKRKNKSGRGKSIWLVFAGLLGLTLLLAFMLNGTDMALFNPKGSIAIQERNLMIVTVLLLFTIGIPTLILLYSFAWEYRESNHKATYDPHTRQSKKFVATMWVIPSIFVLVLAAIMLPATRRLEPKKAIAADAKPLTIQVIAMRWKWLFIYPEQHIATVNYVQFPAGTPVNFELSADETPMSSFWIPHLSGQLYAMTGHVNRLNLIADQTGDYPGSAAEINGAGFAGMRFTAHAGSQQEFDQWVKGIQTASPTLDSGEYAKLLEPSEANPTATYTDVEPGLYANMLMKYAGSHNHGVEHE